MPIGEQFEKSGFVFDVQITVSSFGVAHEQTSSRTRARLSESLREPETVDGLPHLAKRFCSNQRTALRLSVGGFVLPRSADSDLVVPFDPLHTPDSMWPR